MVVLILIANINNYRHTIFGRVLRGMRVVQRMGNVVTDKSDRPVEEVKIYTANIQQMIE